MARNAPLLQIVALALLVIGLARPQVPVGVKRVSGAGIDIVLTLDISGSMGAEDMGSKSRVAAAKEVLADFIAKAGANRLGLVVFAQQAFTQAPLTADHHMVTDLLKDVDIGMLEDGTAIGMAIATAANRLRNSEAKSKVIILLTDGANNAGEIDPVTAARAADALGVKIYAIGFGSAEAARMATGTPGAGAELDEDTLREVAGDTGEYFRATDEEALRDIYAQIDAMEKSEYLGSKQVEYRQLYGRFVWPALMLLALQFFLTSTWLRKAP
jgi:Ca-activated chloride channel family protein